MSLKTNQKKEHYLKGSKNDYRLNGRRFLGKGAFSTVHSGLNINTNEKVAIKKIAISKMSDYEIDVIDRELKIVNTLIDSDNPHDNIVKYYDVIRNKTNVYIIMELCSDGTFSSLLVKPLREKYTKYYFNQILNALVALRTMNIIHRDIKPDNILITDDYKKIKLCDFGFSQIINNYREIDDVICGSPIYMIPKIFQKSDNDHSNKKTSESHIVQPVQSFDKLSSESPINISIEGIKLTPHSIINELSKNSSSFDLWNTDLWAAGMILYEMIYGYHPCKGLKDIYSIKCAMYSVKINYSNNIEINEEGLQLLKELLDVNNLSRLSLNGIVMNPWVNNNFETIDKIVLSKIFYDPNKKILSKSLSKLLNSEKSYDIKSNVHDDFDNICDSSKKYHPNNKIINNGVFDNIIRSNNKLYNKYDQKSMSTNYVNTINCMDYIEENNNSNITSCMSDHDDLSNAIFEMD